MYAREKLSMPFSRSQGLVTQEMEDVLWPGSDPTLLSAQSVRTLKRLADGSAARFKGVPGARGLYLKELKEAL